MTGVGNLTAKGFNEFGRITKPIEPISKGFTELGRFAKKRADEEKRVRRKMGFTTQKPKMLELLDPVKPDPLPTYIEIEPAKKRKKVGRGATILADRMNRRRQILNTKPGGSILR
jgi:hypothetical protein